MVVQDERSALLALLALLAPGRERVEHDGPTRRTHDRS
jgi:hypothetical protein